MGRWTSGSTSRSISYLLPKVFITANVRCGVDIHVNFYIRQKPFWFLRKFWDVDCSTCLLVFWRLQEKCLALATLAKDNVCIPSFVFKDNEDMIWKKKRKKKRETLTSQKMSLELQVDSPQKNYKWIMFSFGFKNLH